MKDIDFFAKEVLNMRSLQIEYSKLMHQRKIRKIDGEELEEAYSQMRKAEKLVHQICLDVLGVEEE